MGAPDSRAGTSGGPQARRAQLIESQLPLVRSIARRFAQRGEPYEDLVQVGTIGLIKAVDRFDPARGNKLSTVAAPAIEGEIRHHLRDGSSVLRTPQRVQAQGGRLSVEQFDENGEDAPRASGAAHEAESRLLLGDGLDALPERERRIVILRYEQDLSQAEIARREGISQATVSRLLQGALDQMRATLDGDVAATSGGAYSRPVQPADKPAAEKAAAETPEQRPAHSGRLLVRMPSSLHDELARAAEREGVSLNTLVTGALAGAVGWRDGSGTDELLRREHGEAAAPRPAWIRYALLANVIVVAVAAIVAIALLVSQL